MRAAEASAQRFADDGGDRVVLRFGQFYAPEATHSLTALKAARRGWMLIPRRAWQLPAEHRRRRCRRRGGRRRRRAARRLQHRRLRPGDAGGVGPDHGRRRRAPTPAPDATPVLPDGGPQGAEHGLLATGVEPPVLRSRGLGPASPLDARGGQPADLRMRTRAPEDEPPRVAPPGAGGDPRRQWAEPRCVDPGRPPVVLRRVPGVRPSLGQRVGAVQRAPAPRLRGDEPRPRPAGPGGHRLVRSHLGAGGVRYVVRVRHPARGLPRGARRSARRRRPLGQPGRPRVRRGDRRPRVAARPGAPAGRRIGSGLTRRPHDMQAAKSRDVYSRW